MKLREHISKGTIQITLGLLIGLFVLTQTVVPSIQHEKTEQTEQSSEEENSYQELKLSDAIPSSSLQINLDFQSFLLEEVTMSDDNEDGRALSELALPSAQKALKVLFRRIISPNAP